MSEAGEHGGGAAWAAVLIAIPGAIVAIIFLIQIVSGDDDSVGGINGAVGTETATAPGPLPTSTSHPTSSVVPTPVPDDDTCQIEVDNPLATIHEEPDNFSQEIIDVPPGTYVVEDFQSVTFGSQEQRWLLITAAGRRGWLKDSTFNIASKSAACP